MEFQMVDGTLDKVPEGYRITVEGEILPARYIWFVAGKDGVNGTWYPGTLCKGFKASLYDAVPVRPTTSPKRPRWTRKGVVVQETSRMALESQKDKAPGDCEKILEQLVQKPLGMTCDELEVLLMMSHQTTSARVRDLAMRGSIRDNGKRRKTRTGRTAIVWEAVGA